MPKKWAEELQEQLIALTGARRGRLLAGRYAAAFPASYREAADAAVAGAAVALLESLTPERPVALRLEGAGGGATLALRLYQLGEPAPLSDLLPLLENMGLKTLSATPYRVRPAGSEQRWILDLAVVHYRGAPDLEATHALFEEAFLRIYSGHCENDGFNQLVLAAALSWREVTLLRAYAKYLHQARFRFSQAYIEKALCHNVALARLLVDLFAARHDPRRRKKGAKDAEALERRIHDALQGVESLDEDKILRRLLALVKATLRTNYFLEDGDGQPKEYLALKLHSATIPELPQPAPLYEIFVYAPHFEAIHLRKSAVARGGLRWSDRAEDFRTEVFGLMKAQVVKNAVIVPSGAKGGFVRKRDTPRGEALRAEVMRCYQSFIRGLLDLTDNIAGGEVVHPGGVVCHDGADPYLVVAADKGTATFSDSANAIAKEYGFWLGDAFASGGATGYDHKKMGITARGAWESVKRHFRELDIDVMSAPITVVGIGDMSGDVFGNGLLYSESLRLVAAFDHRHIFLDPDPDAAVAYRERRRLFALPHSSWEDYNPQLLSAGGGVFRRSLKAIPLSAQVRRRLGVEERELPPNELIKAILRAPVDLLFNGGIGTYVKASGESHLDVGDRANDYCRVDGQELRCQVVCEGGNLGFTQLGRVEYARNGGRVNTDFIDNAGGVNCSDHEVNLKILLDGLVRRKQLSAKRRDELLASLTQEIADLVLDASYRQALVLSYTAMKGGREVSLYKNYLGELESLGIVKRRLEFLPDDKSIVERKAAGEGFARPELAVLLAFTKIHIKQELLRSAIPDNRFLAPVLATAFPASVAEAYRDALWDHPLRREIIATQLSNKIVDEMGITYFYRIQSETGATIADIVKAFTLASQTFDSGVMQDAILELGFKVPLTAQYEMLYHIRHLVNLATRWFLYSAHLHGDLDKVIGHFTPRVRLLEGHIATLMSGQTKEYLAKLTEEFHQLGLPEHKAQRIATYRAIYATLNIIEVATQYQFDLMLTAQVYFFAGERLSLLWFRDQIARDSREGHWNVLARLSLRDELDLAQRSLAIAIMQHDADEGDADKLIDGWMQHNEEWIVRWRKLLAMVVESNTVDYTMFFIAIRELVGFIGDSRQRR